MRWKLLTLIAALVVTTSAPPSKVAAQGLVEYALILVVVAVGPGEIAEIQWVPGPSQGKTQGPRSSPGDTVVFTYVVTNTGDSTCTQTISSEVGVNDGLNTLIVTRNAEFLLINGEAVGEQLMPCLWDPNRNAIAVGVPSPPGLAAQGAADPNALAYELQNVQIVAWDVSGSADGDTRAAGLGGLRPGNYTITEISP